MKTEQKIEVRRGKIRGLFGSWGTGLAYFRIEPRELPANVRRMQDEGKFRCDGFMTARGLEEMFGNVIGTTDRWDCPINNETGGHVGKEVFYAFMEEDNLLLGVMSVHSGGKGFVVGTCPADLADKVFVAFNEAFADRDARPQLPSYPGPTTPPKQETPEKWLSPS